MSSGWIMALGVGAGGFVGSICRYGLGVAFARLSSTWPLGTFAANVAGCFFIGAIMALTDRVEISPVWRVALATGFCGGFTTMSSFVFEGAQMVRSGENVMAAFYVFGTLAFSVAAFFAGTIVVRWGGGA